ncbi:MAG: peptidase M23 [Rhodospirillaceae bacterium]|nr:MAG: peptidase M23 [Rhodospirillaceae bacterium]
MIIDEVRLFRHNRFMMPDSARSFTPMFSRIFARLCAMLTVLAVSGCGWASISSDGPTGPTSRNRPQAVLTNDAFINASAVRVGRGDTVYSIARRHKLSPRDLIEANGLRPPYELNVGQRLVLPQGSIHTVQSGEYIALIAKRYNADTFALARINGIRSPYTIFPGQKLRIPRSGGEPLNVQVARAPKTTSTLWVEPKGSPQPSVRPSRPSAQPKAQAKAKVPEPPKRSGGKFSWPLKGKILSNYGTKDKGLQNDGVNIAAARGTLVKASENGVVAYAGNEIRGFGNLLLIKHDGGWVTAYAHNDTLLVKRGDKVTRGQQISKVGSTGSVTTPQLHFELRKGSRAVDPHKYLM